MARKKHTTVILTEKAQFIKDDLAPIFGLKNIISAGLILFGKLTDANQKEIINEANDNVKSPQKPEPTISESFARLLV